MFNKNVQNLDSSTDFGSESIDISEFTVGSIEIDTITKGVTSSSAQIQVSNDNTHWGSGSTAAINITTTGQSFLSIDTADMSFNYIRVYYTHTDTGSFVCVQKIFLKKG